MITDIIILLLSSFVGLISTAFGYISSFTVVQEISDSVTYFLSYLNYLSGILPINNILKALGTLILFYTAWYTVKIILWIFSLIPWFGKPTEVPKFGGQEAGGSLILRSGHGINLKNQKAGKNVEKHIDKRMRF